MTFRNKLIFYGEELLAPRPTPKLDDHPLSAVRDCLFNIFAANLHNWRPSPPSATWGRAMPWWPGTHLTWAVEQHWAKSNARNLKLPCFQRLAHDEGQFIIVIAVQTGVDCAKTRMADKRYCLHPFCGSAEYARGAVRFYSPESGLAFESSEC
jgi:hypothetical protein